MAALAAAVGKQSLYVALGFHEPAGRARVQAVLAAQAALAGAPAVGAAPAVSQLLVACEERGHRMFLQFGGQVRPLGGWDRGWAALLTPPVAAAA